jgi:hypothetical protein
VPVGTQASLTLFTQDADPCLAGRPAAAGRLFGSAKTYREISAVLLMGLDLREKYLDACIEIFRAGWFVDWRPAAVVLWFSTRIENEKQ